MPGRVPGKLAVKTCCTLPVRLWLGPADITKRWRGKGERQDTEEDLGKGAPTDPYFGVLTHDKYKSDALDDAARDEFFKSGAANIEKTMARCRRLRGADFTPATALDFGCGVGRLALPLARLCQSVVGIDVSPSMLDEARSNAARFGLENIDFRLSDYSLSRVPEQFDLVHTMIVLQHIPVDRGTEIFAGLVDRIAPGGCGAIQVTYAKAYAVPAPAQPVQRKRIKLPFRKPKTRAPEPSDTPEMQMNPYDLNALFKILQDRGVAETHVEFTDHGGELGVFLTFVKP